MRVVSLIKRADGHVVKLGDVAYAFRPPTYAAEVEDPRHLARFSEIPEGYVIQAHPEPPPIVAPVRRRGRPPKRLSDGDLAG
ncbi:MAG: hypothetical protein EOM21_19470 [Gammaproteobacteria bacterium]|nr:hypothetical protein [Gammaproteobacteria bacterium]